MKTRKIILANNSRLLQDMLMHIFKKADGLRVVQEQIGLADIHRTIQQTHADWLVISAEQPNGVVEALEAAHPDVRIITVSPDGSPIQMRGQSGPPKDLDGLTVCELLSILRDEKEVSVK